MLWLAYGLLMPVGLITARHLQTVTPKWFAIHWGIQLLAVMLAMIGFFIGVAKFGADAATESRHARMGIAVFTFTLAQPLLGVIRPHKGNKVRPHKGNKVRPHKGNKVRPHKGNKVRPHKGNKVRPHKGNKVRCGGSVEMPLKTICMHAWVSCAKSH
ncbi:unnamed protein product [Closterium sp. Yama58-4]|nr:unnamed protein product [Closterium sp. Yama58-4]